MPKLPNHLTPAGPSTSRTRALLEFLRTEAGGGVVLLAATLVAIVWANSPWQQSYHDVWHHKLVVGSGGWAVRESLGHWVNDALMAVFFFVVGLEIKRELVRGELHDRRAAALPVLAAVGGMVVPAVLFWAVVGSGDGAAGWGIPMATDIAFAVGLLAVLGERVPRSLKVFVLTFAIVDDIGAILVIAVFYASGLNPAWLLGAGAVLAVVVAARRFGVTWPLAYAPLALLTWYCTYRSGVHPTIAGVALGLLTPAEPVGGREVLEDLEHRLHPLSSYVVIPVFALANAGVALGAQAITDAAGSRLTWGVIVGLVVGKAVGITGATVTGGRTGLGRLPAGVGLAHVAGAGALGGIGFTVSLFITSLAFESEVLQTHAKMGILGGSLTAAVLGAVILGRRSGPAAGVADRAVVDASREE